MKHQRDNLFPIVAGVASIGSFLLAIIFLPVDFIKTAIFGVVIIFIILWLFIRKPVAKPIAEIERVWLVIEKVELFGSLINGRFNLKAFVNNTSYKYLSRAGVEWAKAGAGMSSQQFKLPVNEEGYEVYFTMNVRRENECICELLSQKTDVIVNLSKLPFQGQYNLYLKEGVTIDSGVLATVRYKITTTLQ